MIVRDLDLLAQPDGFVGSILAVEGITDACTILNGPTGCKMHLGEISKDQFRRENDSSVMRWAEEFFFQQDRVPCTYLDDYDYVFGTAEKLEYIFPRVAEKGYSYIAVLNSPGASLIGDDLQRYIEWAALKVPTVVLEKPHFAEPFESGWVDAACLTIDALAPSDVPCEEQTVNLVGLSIWQKDWAGSRAELERLLALCGMKVHATLLADCTVEQIRQLRCAACNVIVQDELGWGVAQHLQERYGMPYVRCDCGALSDWTQRKRGCRPSVRPSAPHRRPPWPISDAPARKSRKRYPVSTSRPLCLAASVLEWRWRPRSPGR